MSYRLDLSVSSALPFSRYGTDPDGYLLTIQGRLMGYLPEDVDAERALRLGLKVEDDDEIPIGEVRAVLLNVFHLQENGATWYDALDCAALDEMAAAVKALHEGDEEETRFLIVEAVQIHPGFRGQALGARMVDHLIDSFGLWSGGRCLLMPHPITPPAEVPEDSSLLSTRIKKLEVYWQKHGFSPVDADPRVYQRDCTRINPALRAHNKKQTMKQYEALWDADEFKSMLDRLEVNDGLLTRT